MKFCHVHYPLSKLLLKNAGFLQENLVYNWCNWVYSQGLCALHSKNEKYLEYKERKDQLLSNLSKGVYRHKCPEWILDIYNKISVVYCGFSRFRRTKWLADFSVQFSGARCPLSFSIPVFHSPRCAFFPLKCPIPFGCTATSPFPAPPHVLPQGWASLGYECS